MLKIIVKFIVRFIKGNWNLHSGTSVMAIIRKLQKTKKDQYTLTIPKAIVEILGFKEQDKFEFELKDKKIILKKRGGKK